MIAKIFPVQPSKSTGSHGKKALFNSPHHVLGSGTSSSVVSSSYFWVVRFSASSALRFDVANPLVFAGFFFKSTGASPYCDLIESEISLRPIFASFLGLVLKLKINLIAIDFWKVMMVRLILEFPFLSLPQFLRTYTFLVQTYSKESPLLHSKDTLLYRFNHFLDHKNCKNPEYSRIRDLWTRTIRF